MNALYLTRHPGLAPGLGLVLAYNLRVIPHNTTVPMWLGLGYVLVSVVG